MGGDVFAAVLPLLRPQARISLCGLISQQNNDDAPKDAHAAWFDIGKTTFDSQSVQVHKLFVGDYVEEHEASFLERMARWIQAGQMRYKEDITQGIENTPETFARMLVGKTFGKTLVQVAEDPTKKAARAARL